MDAEDHTAAPVPRYRVVDRPAPHLARLLDRRTGVTRRWVRVRLGARRFGRPRSCANCGAPLAAPFYRPPALPISGDRLCATCVEGADV